MPPHHTNKSHEGAERDGEMRRGHDFVLPLLFVRRRHLSFVVFVEKQNLNPNLTVELLDNPLTHYKSATSLLVSFVVVGRNLKKKINK